MGKLQNIDTGGIYTHYDANLSPYGYTNVETTSLTVMAYPAWNSYYILTIVIFITFQFRDTGS